MYSGQISMSCKISMVEIHWEKNSARKATLHIPEVLEMTPAVAADIAPRREMTFCLFSSIVLSIHLFDA